MTRCFSLSCQELSIRYSLNQCGVSFILHLNKEVLLKMEWIVLLFKGYIMLVLIPLVQFLYSPWLLIACDFFSYFYYTESSVLEHSEIEIPVYRVGRMK